MIDLTIRDEGTIFLVIPESDQGHFWVNQHLPDDAPRFSGAVVVEHRFIVDIVEGAINDGLTVAHEAGRKG